MKKSKVAIVGCGKVGLSAAFTIFLKGTAGELVLYSRNKEKLLGEQLDIQHSLSFLSTMTITIADSFTDLKGCDIIIFTAGSAQEPGETRLDLTQKNTKILEQMIPEIVKYAPSAIIIMVTNPVDIMTYKAFRLAGVPFGKIFGSGTTLDTARFRFHLSEYLHVNPRSIHAYILGEHGDSSFPTLSAANIGGQHLSTFPGFSNEMALDAFQKARDAAYKIIETKGATYYAIGVVISELVEAILHDARKVYPLSIPLEGRYGHTNVAMSVPCVLGKRGVEQVLEIPLSIEEKEQLDKSAETLKSVISS